MTAHIDMGRLEEEGVTCWLKDENTVTIDPILSNAIGGIKLMVALEDFDRAREILLTLKDSYKKTLACPRCHSHEIELVSSPRNVRNLFSIIGTWLVGNYALSTEKTYHCFNCSFEFPEPEQVVASPDPDTNVSST